LETEGPFAIDGSDDSLVARTIAAGIHRRNFSTEVGNFVDSN
jgi:hypothetical protein